MKKVLVTGINSYVGNRFAEWVKQYPDEYDVDRISVRDAKWKEIELSTYDVIVHVAGIAHRKETKENAELYYQVNRDLANEIATKAKKEKVKQFIFLSSMSVYGLNKGVIDKDTPLRPKSHYGKSKLQAEEEIQDLEDSSFKVAIVRPPMIYGEGCKGNYQRLRKLALKTPIFPDVKNKRSMIYIDNLSEFIKNLIDDSRQGVYCPQNKEYVNTSELVQIISKQHDKRILITKLFNPLLRIMQVEMVNKVFGDLIYIKSSFDYRFSYHVNDFISSIEASENVESGNNG